MRPNVVYAGIGRPRWAKGGAGAIYRSTDTGQTWQRIAEGQLPSDAIVSQVAIQPGQSKTLLAATDKGIFRSEDEGNTWRDSSAGLSHRYAKRVAFAASSPAVVYASLWTTARDSEPFNGGVFRSDDAGQHWREVNGPGLSRRVGKRSEPAQMTSSFAALAVDRATRMWSMRATIPGLRPGCTRRPTAAAHWTLITVGGKQGNTEVGWITMWGFNVECLSVSPANPDYLAFGTSGLVFVTADAGRTWQQRYSRSLPDGRFAGTGLEVTCMNSIVCDPSRTDRRYYCYADIGLLISDDDGRTFRRSFQGMKNVGNCFTVVADPKSPATLWAGTGCWSITPETCVSRRTTARRGRWWDVRRPDYPMVRRDTSCSIRAAPRGKRHLIVTCQDHGIYESRDGGRSWSCISGDLPADAIRSPAGLLLHADDSNRLTFAAGGPPQKGGGMYGTNDGGKTWRRPYGEVPFGNIQCLACDPHHSDVLYLGAREHFETQPNIFIPAACSRAATAEARGNASWRTGS